MPRIPRGRVGSQRFRPASRNTALRRCPRRASVKSLPAPLRRPPLALERLLPGLAQLQTRTVLLSGGEPLLKPEWAEITQLLTVAIHPISAEELVTLR